MVDELSLAPDVVSAQLASAVDPWLERRRHSWGASEIPALLLAYDRREEEAASARRYHLDDSGISRAGVPRIVARKAGLLAAKAGSRAMRAGAERERELIDRWSSAAGFDDVRLESAAPREWYPLVDRHCHRLAATPDAWCRGPSGELIIVEAKCTAGHHSHVEWYWRVQLQAQIACTSAAAGVLVCGRGWVMGSDSEPIGWIVERDDAEIERIRAVAIKAWADVERLREGADNEVHRYQ